MRLTSFTRLWQSASSAREVALLLGLDRRKVFGLFNRAWALGHRLPELPWNLPGQLEALNVRIARGLILGDQEELFRFAAAWCRSASVERAAAALQDIDARTARTIARDLRKLGVRLPRRPDASGRLV